MSNTLAGINLLDWVELIPLCISICVWHTVCIFCTYFQVVAMVMMMTNHHLVVSGLGQGVEDLLTMMMKTSNPVHVVNINVSTTHSLCSYILSFMNQNAVHSTFWSKRFLYQTYPCFSAKIFTEAIYSWNRSLVCYIHILKKQQSALKCFKYCSKKIVYNFCNRLEIGRAIKNKEWKIVGNHQTQFLSSTTTNGSVCIMLCLYKLRIWWALSSPVNWTDGYVSWWALFLMWTFAYTICSNPCNYFFSSLSRFFF